MVLRSQFGAPLVTPIPISFTASGDNVIVPAVAGAVIELYQIWFVINTAASLTWKDGSTPISGTFFLGAGGSVVLDFSGAAWLSTSAGNALVLNSNVLITCGGVAYYIIR